MLKSKEVSGEFKIKEMEEKKKSLRIMTKFWDHTSHTSHPYNVSMLLVFDYRMNTLAFFPKAIRVCL